jgi:hypothetical protein
MPRASPFKSSSREFVSQMTGPPARAVDAAKTSRSKRERIEAERGRNVLLSINKVSVVLN